MHNKILGLVALLTLFTTLSYGQRKVQKEMQERAYYINDEGKKVYFPNTKTQKMWNEILEECPGCLKVAEKYNVNIYQNMKYEKPVKPNMSTYSYQREESVRKKGTVAVEEPETP